MDKIQEYIINVESDQARLNELDAFFSEKIAGSEKKIVCKWPTYKLEKNIIKFKGTDTTTDINPGPIVMETLKEEFKEKGIATTKTVFKLPHNEAVDYAYLEQIVNMAIEFNNQ